LLAVNVLQPLKGAYPNIVVVSGFRQVNTGIGQHELGEAVDLQIRNQTPVQLFEVADYISKNLNFDQLDAELDGPRRRAGLDSCVLLAEVACAIRCSPRTLPTRSTTACSSVSN
jgi:hypothetical protein